MLTTDSGGNNPYINVYAECECGRRYAVAREQKGFLVTNIATNDTFVITAAAPICTEHTCTKNLTLYDSFIVQTKDLQWLKLPERYYNNG